jgi:methylenetetrahydrofolate reductase (NADPH)
MQATLENKLKAGRFVLTAEVAPPVSCCRDELLDKALPLKGLADAVNVTDSAGARAALGAVTSAAMLLEQGIEPVLQLTCRDRNRIALQSDLMSAAATGVRNLLILRGDDPSAGDQPDAKAVFDLDPRSLLETARHLRDSGELPTGKKVSGQAPFFLGAADNPIDPAADWQPNALKAKIAAGAQFMQTQFCLDAGVVRRYCEVLSRHGIDKQLYLLIGVVPLRSAKSARWIKEKLFGAIVPDELIDRMEQASDPLVEGKLVCLELIEALSNIPGVSGAHIMAPGNDAAVPDVISSARQRVKWLAPA